MRSSRVMQAALDKVHLPPRQISKAQSADSLGEGEQGCIEGGRSKRGRIEGGGTEQGKTIEGQKGLRGEYAKWGKGRVGSKVIIHKPLR